MVLFLYGTMRHDALFNALTGATGEGQVASLRDHRVMGQADGLYPMLIAHAGAHCDGKLRIGLTPEQRLRIDTYEAAFGYLPRAVQIHLTDGTTLAAEAYFPPEDQASSGAEWSYAAWEAALAKPSLHLAAELLSHAPPLTADEIAARWMMLERRAFYRSVAEQGRPPARHRHGAVADDYASHAVGSPHGAFFTLNAIDVQHRRFDGTRSPVLRREVFYGTDASLVLPYDPKRDRVLLVEQFRCGPMLRHDPNPWTLEPVAGMIDAFETPEAAARRETTEEAGLALASLAPMFALYPSPGSSTDHFYCFLGICDLPQEEVYFGGLEAEAEDLRLHPMALDTALDLIDTGEINAAPLAAMLLWLARHRDRERAGNPPAPPASA